MDNHPRWRILGYYLRWGIVVSINPNRSRLAQGFPAVLIPCLAAVSLAGCVDKRGGPIPYNVASFGVPDSPTVVPLETGYKIAPMDMLSVKVFKMPDLSGEYEVDLTGQISMPLVGSMARRT